MVKFNLGVLTAVCCFSVVFCNYCLRRLTFCQQQQKVSKKCRPSSAGEADFPQIALWNARDGMACLGCCFFFAEVQLEIRGKSEVVWSDGIGMTCGLCFFFIGFRPVGFEFILGGEAE